MKRYLCAAWFALTVCNAYSAYTTQQADRFTHLREQRVQCVSFLFTDLLGDLKEVTMPIEYAQQTWQDGISFDGSSIPGYARITQSDMLLKPDINTMRVIPWLQGANKTAVVLCDVYRDKDTPYEADPRSLLKKICGDIHQMGYQLNVGPELEFFFIDRNTQQPIDTQGYFAAQTNIQRFVQNSSILQLLTSFDINVEKLHHEVATGQHEVSLHYGNPVELADQIILTKYALRSIVKEYGFDVTFMPKPFAGQNGSAMHIHFSLWDTQRQKNAFYDEHNEHQFSNIGRSFLAGLLAHVKELSLLFNPTINSFKRLVPGYEAPIFICWGTKNRSALVRLPQTDSSNAMRAEIRCPDPLCNPYLAFAGLATAGLQGVLSEQPLESAVEDNLYTLSLQEIEKRHIQALPTSLNQSLELFAASSYARTFLGTALVEQLLALKRKEAHAFATAVTNWEWQKYL